MKKLLIFAIFLSSLFFHYTPSYAEQNDQLIIINKTTNELAFFENNELVRTFSVATGRTDALTPEGTFKIVNKIKNRPYYTDGIPGGDPRNPLGDRWLGLDARGTAGTTYAIHGNNNETSIGKYISAGCIRMHNDEVHWLFDQVKLETTVIITHSEEDFIALATTYGYDVLQYFHADQNLTVYDNSTGKLIKIGSLNKGQIFPRISDFGNWYKIQFGNQEGFVYKPATSSVDRSTVTNLNTPLKNSSRSFTTINDAIVYDTTSEIDVPMATISKETTYPIVDDYGTDWYQIIVSGRVGYIAKADTNYEEKFFKTKTNVTVYDNSSGKLVKIGTLIEGEIYPRIRDYGNWHEIQYGNGLGYVYKGATSVAGGNSVRGLNTSFENSDTVVVVKNDAPVYDNSSGKLIPFATIAEGETYPIVNDYGPNWYRVIVSGRVGYIHKKDLE